MIMTIATHAKQNSKQARAFKKRVQPVKHTALNKASLTNHRREVEDINMGGGVGNEEVLIYEHKHAL